MQEPAEGPAGIISISHDATIQDAAALMLSHNVGCLIVNDESGRFVGLVSERDVAHYVAQQARQGGLPGDSPSAGLSAAPVPCVEASDQATIAQIMTERVISCAPGTPAHEAMRIMAAHHVRHLPVVEGDIVVGVLSARDLMAQRLFEDRAAAEEVAVLSKCLRSIDLDEATEIVATEAPKLFEADSCVLCLYADGDVTGRPDFVNSNRCLCFDGAAPSPEVAQNVPPEGGLCADLPAVCAEHGGRAPRLILPLDIASPQMDADDPPKRLSGFICMCGLSPSSTSNRELTSYKACLTRQIVAAHLTNAARYQQARLTSLTDALTGVGSRKLLEDKLQAECDRGRRYKRPFSVAIIDLDHFKMINDTLGHAEGDEAIKKLAQCMGREKRTPDVLARYGGDEFVLLMPETRADDAAILLERIRAKVLQIELDQGMSMSISCGISEHVPEQDESASEVMRRADLALYEAKNAGRNCVIRWNKTMGQLLSGSDIEIEKIKRLQRRVVGLSEKAERLFVESIWGLVQALEAKDAFARKHSENVMHYAIGIARAQGLGPKHLDLIRRAAMVHDVGKIGIPDAILFKPGPLTPHERRTIEQHPMIAVRILERMSFLEREIAIVRHHHERWNGRGYPDRLARTAIPLGARIVAVADTFDALTSDRAYHACRPVAEAVRILEDAAGYDLDPAAVEAMLTWIEDMSRQLGKSLDELTADDLLQQQEDVQAELLLSPPAQVETAAVILPVS